MESDDFSDSCLVYTREVDARSLLNARRAQENKTSLYVVDRRMDLNPDGSDPMTEAFFYLTSSSSLPFSFPDPHPCTVSSSVSAVSSPPSVL